MYPWVLYANRKQADKLYAAINHLSDKICLLTEESVAFVNGVVITTAHMAKGLEFDEVIVPFVTDKTIEQK